MYTTLRRTTSHGGGDRRAPPSADPSPRRGGAWGSVESGSPPVGSTVGVAPGGASHSTSVCVLESEGEGDGLRLGLKK